MAQASSYDPAMDAARLALQGELAMAADTPVIERALSYIKSSGTTTPRILDAGCGTGSATIARFGELDAVVLGVDRSKEAIAEARRLAGHRVQIRFVASELEAFDPGDVKYDLVFCALVLHVASDPGAVVKKLWSLVAPGGVLVVRSLDDGLMLCWPDSEDNRIISQLTPIVFAEVDRFHGRSLPLMLNRLKDVEHLEVGFPAITTLTKPGMEGQISYFDVVQGWKTPAVMDVTSLPEERQGMYRELEIAIANERRRFASEEVFASSCMMVAGAYKARS
jgi:SAM-dependent methyltransferase